jgi:hypothetical protein
MICFWLSTTVSVVALSSSFQNLIFNNVLQVASHRKQSSPLRKYLADITERS